MRHHDVQILGGAAMTQQALIEMEAGEGKTLVAYFTGLSLCTERQRRARDDRQ